MCIDHQCTIELKRHSLNFFLVISVIYFSLIIIHLHFPIFSQKKLGKFLNQKQCKKLFAGVHRTKSDDLFRLGLLDLTDR